MFKMVDNFLNNIYSQEKTESNEKTEPPEQAEPVEPAELAKPAEPAELTKPAEPVEPAKTVESVEKNEVVGKPFFSGLFDFFTKHLACSTNKDDVIAPSNKPVELETPEPTAI